jgi:hypothetical protein
LLVLAAFGLELAMAASHVLDAFAVYREETRAILMCLNLSSTAYFYWVL